MGRFLSDKVTENIMFKLQKALHRDAINLASNLRDIDKLEVECTGSTPEASLLRCFDLPKSEVLSGLSSNNEVILMCGVSECPINPDVGVIWMLASPSIRKHRKDIVRLSKDTIDMLCVGYKSVYNLIHKDNKTSIRWLEWCGFTVDKTKTYEQGGEDFYLLIKES
jgi:hypothetical protein